LTAASRKQVPIDWDALEIALTWRDSEGRGHWLDLMTGQVIGPTGTDEEPSEEELDDRLAEGRLIAIEPLESSVEYGWMQDFAVSVADPVLRRLLAVALDGRGAFRRFKDVLADYPSERERWFAFHGEHVRAAAREWLEENGINAARDPR
jgi:hypothetical protein